MAYSNATQSIPPLFKEIMRNHNETDALMKNMNSQADWRKLRTLRNEMFEFRRGAEKALRWNTDKGNTA